MNPQEREVQKLLESLTPDQQNFAKAVATMRIENQTYRKQIADMKREYDELFKVMIVLLCVDVDHELRIHESQFKRFKAEYRINKSFDKETGELVLKRKTLTDD
jgi:hypothetical protein